MRRAIPLMSLARSETKTLNAMKKEVKELGKVPIKAKKVEGAYMVKITVDSGAADSVCEPAGFPTYLLKEGEGSNAGVTYTTASGEEIPNLGEHTVQVVTQENQLCTMKFQATNVDKTLLSVSALGDIGHDVLFRKKGGVITHIKTGKQTKFHREGGMHVLRVWVLPSSASGAKQTPINSRQAKP